MSSEASALGPRPGRVTERRLVVLMGAVVFVDTMFYAAIAPLLPALTHSLDLSKLSAGVMSASYALGTLAASLPSGIFAVRFGPKRTVFLGLGLLAGSTLAFGWLQDAALLDVARLVEGIGGACSWAGGLAWIVADAPAERRGALIGSALGAAIGGMLFGPVIGTLAGAIGRGPAFSAATVMALVLIGQTRTLPVIHSRAGQSAVQLRRALRSRRLWVGMWLVALPATVSGALNVLGPLRLHLLGAGAAGVGATYVGGAAAEAALTPVIGRWSDRRGRLLPLGLGLGGTIALLCLFTAPGTAVVLALVIVAAQLTLAGFWAPAMAMTSDTAERRGLEPGMAAALMNLAWALGATIGGAAGGALAKAAGDGLPMFLVAGLCGATLAGLLRRRPSGEPFQ